MAAKSFREIFQFKITLLDTSPPVWRRLQVPGNYSFWDLHVALQDCIGWTDSHLHMFKIRKPGTGNTMDIGVPDDEGFDDIPLLAGWDENIEDWFLEENSSAIYIYDFGDDWYHELVLEKILPRAAGKKYPVCLDGARACPPEDCGGVDGYEELLEIIADPEHAEYEEMMKWLGGGYDPEFFDGEKVKFTDPAKRLNFLFER